MMSLDDFNYNGIKLSVLNVTLKTITIRISNSSETINSFNIEGTRFISKKKGILELTDVEPYDIQDDGISLLNDSFIDVKMTFNQGHLNDGDRLELHINDGVNILIESSSDIWNVCQVVSLSEIENRLIEKTQILDTLFEQVGISLQNVSYKLSGYKGVDMFYEVVSNGPNKLEHYININIVLYDNKNRIISKDESFLDNDNFIGFQVFNESLDLKCDISQISKIVVFPVLG